jgi:hypothetical protein
VPGQLETADDLFSKGRHADALAAYQQFADFRSGSPAGIEARFKAITRLSWAYRSATA